MFKCMNGAEIQTETEIDGKRMTSRVEKLNSGEKIIIMKMTMMMFKPTADFHASIYIGMHLSRDPLHFCLSSSDICNNNNCSSFLEPTAVCPHKTLRMESHG